MSNCEVLEPRKCVICHKYFAPRYTWATKCLPCWKYTKKLEEANETVKIEYRDRIVYQDRVIHKDRIVYQDRIVRVADHRLPNVEEWQKMLMPLLKLAHPDRHGNSAESNAVTRWLLDERHRVNGAC